MGSFFSIQIKQISWLIIWCYVANEYAQKLIKSVCFCSDKLYNKYNDEYVNRLSYRLFVDFLDSANIFFYYMKFVVTFTALVQFKNVKTAGIKTTKRSGMLSFHTKNASSYGS